MPTTNEKIVPFNQLAAARLASQPVALAPDQMDPEQTVGRLLRKLENDVAAIVSNTSPEAPEQQPLKTSAAPEPVALQPLADEDAQPLPRMFTGQAPATGNQERRQEDFAEYKFAAFRGFCIGIIAIVPALVWITFSLLPSSNKASDTAGAAQKAASDIVMTTAALTPKLVSPPRQEAGPAASLALSAELIRQGRVAEARVLLAASTFASLPSVAMALAETYDPNMLAAWNALEVEPDVTKAKALYEQAVEGGIAGATKRLAALR